MASWPASLPQSLFYALTRTRQSGALRSETDTGPAKQRARFTATAKRFEDASMKMTGAQLTVFYDFFEDTLGEGAASFTWIDPITDVSATLRFMAAPQDVMLAGAVDPDERIYNVTLPLELLP